MSIEVTCLTKSGADSGTTVPIGPAAAALFGDLHPDQVGQRGVDGGEVALHDGAAPLAVGLVDRGLDPATASSARQDPGKGEEARLHHGVDPVAELGLGGDLVARRRPRTGCACPATGAAPRRAGGPRPRPARRGC